jgi:hypothetical protein
LWCPYTTIICIEQKYQPFIVSIARRKQEFLVRLNDVAARRLVKVELTLMISSKRSIA